MTQVCECLCVWLCVCGVISCDLCVVVKSVTRVILTSSVPPHTLVYLHTRGYTDTWVCSSAPDMATWTCTYVVLISPLFALRMRLHTHTNTYTHTNTHAQRERARERGREGVISRNVSGARYRHSTRQERERARARQRESKRAREPKRRT